MSLKFYFGKTKQTRNPSQKNYLSQHHCLTRERRGGDVCVTDLQVSAAFKPSFLKWKDGFFIQFIYGLDNRHIMICHSQIFLIRRRRVTTLYSCRYLRTNWEEKRPELSGFHKANVQYLCDFCPLTVRTDKQWLQLVISLGSGDYYVPIFEEF